MAIICRRVCQPAMLMCLVVLLCAASAASFGEPSTTPPTAPATTKAAPALPAVPKGVRAIRDLAYVPGGDRAQVLDLYLPEQPAPKPLPVIVWIHGGGWRGGSKAGGVPALPWVTAGYAVASVEYRFSQKALFPAQIQDCQAAIRYLRGHAKEYNLDPQHFGAWGASAGGHLVALLGTAAGKFEGIGDFKNESDGVQAVCDYFGPADFTRVVAHAAADKEAKNIFKFNSPGDPYSLLIGANLEDAAKAGAVSPMHYVGKHCPPMLAVHGTKDTLVPYAQSVEFVDALKKAGVDATLHTVPGAGHGGGAFGGPLNQDVVKPFFDKHLRGIKPKSDTALPSKPTSRP